MARSLVTFKWSQTDDILMQFNYDIFSSFPWPMQFSSFDIIINFILSSAIGSCHYIEYQQRIKAGFMIVVGVYGNYCAFLALNGHKRKMYSTFLKCLLEEHELLSCLLLKLSLILYLSVTMGHHPPFYEISVNQKGLQSWQAFMVISAKSWI